MATIGSYSHYLRRWQTYMLALSVIGLIGVIYQAYAQTYTNVDLGWPWKATQLWLHGIDPYSETASIALQNGKQLSGFPYPFPVILLFVPLAQISLAWASTIWACIGFSAALTLPILAEEHPPLWAPILPLLFFPFWAALELAQWGLFFLAVMLLVLLLLRHGRAGMAGLFVPLLLLKPQIGIALVAALCVYAHLQGSRRRWWEGLLLGLLIWWGSSFLVDATWPIRWLQQIRRYSDEGQNSVIAFSLSGALLAVLSLALAVRAWFKRDAVLALTAVMLFGMLVMPMRSVYNQSVFLLPLALLVSRFPRLVLAATLASWIIFPLAFGGIDSSNQIALSLYAPLAVVLTLASFQAQPVRVITI